MSWYEDEKSITFNSLLYLGGAHKVLDITSEVNMFLSGTGCAC